MSVPAAFLDRDGTLNAPLIVDGRPQPPARAEELQLLPGVEAACTELSAAGFRLICVTNQPDIARGTQDPQFVATLNGRLKELLGLDEVVTCPHDDADGCACRKPKPGMILDSAERWDVDLSRSVTVGDRWRDVEAGRSAGTHTVFIDRGYAERTPEDPDLTVADLKEAVPWIIATAEPPR
jgi:D-glycero-D-manno-heptose 1,7-bisphosphate phosphatase